MKSHIHWLFLAGTILYIANTVIYQRVIESQRRLITTQANTITKLEAGMDLYQHQVNLLNAINGPARTNQNR